MEWSESLKTAINFMEKHLLEDISAEDVADEVNISSFYLQRGFKIMTGYSMSEYLRCRRLYMAALDVIANGEKVIDLAYKYGYDTPESFTKAFTRFHGASPMQLRKDCRKIKTFLPLKIVVSIQGGNNMDFTVEKMNGFKVIGFERMFSAEESYTRIPEFWDECRSSKTYCMEELWNGKVPETPVEKAICDYTVGEFGICIDDTGIPGKFRYMIAGTYHGGEVPEGMTVFEFPDMEWAKFRCCGSMPGALQSVNTRIFNEWLPGNTEYEIAAGANIEWYSKGDTAAADYESAIWIPVKRK